MKFPKNIALYLLMFNLFITFSSVGIIIPVMPGYLKLFGAAGQVFGFMIAIFSLAQFLFSPFSGTMSDRYGRKNLIVFGLFIHGLSQIIMGSSTDLWMLFVGRFMTGLGSAFIVPPVMAYAADLTSQKDRGKAMSWLGAAISLGFMIGPGIGGLLSNVNIHFPFYFGGVVTIIAGILSFIVLPKIKPVIQKQSKKSDNILLQLSRSFKTRYFVLLIVVFVFSFGIANFQSTLTMFLTYKHDYTPNDIAIVLTAGGFVGVILQAFVLNRLFQLFGEIKVILWGLLTAAFSLYGLLYVSDYFIIIFVATIFSTATTLIRPAVNTLISKTAGSEQGFAAGMNNAYMSLGNMIGPALAGTLFDWNMDAPFTFGSIILLCGFSICLYWTRKSSSQREIAS